MPYILINIIALVARPHYHTHTHTRMYLCSTLKYTCIGTFLILILN